MKMPPAHPRLRWVRGPFACRPAAVSKDRRKCVGSEGGAHASIRAEVRGLSRHQPSSRTTAHAFIRRTTEAEETLLLQRKRMFARCMCEKRAHRSEQVGFAQLPER